MAEHSSGGYETRDMQVKPVVISGLIMGVTALLAFWGSYHFFHGLETREAHRDPIISPLAEVGAQRALPPTPRLQVIATNDLNALHASEKATLNSYGWTNKASGTARIPISRAIELMSDQLPSRTAAAPAAPSQDSGSEAAPTEKAE